MFKIKITKRQHDKDDKYMGYIGESAVNSIEDKNDAHYELERKIRSLVADKEKYQISKYKEFATVYADHVEYTLMILQEKK